MPTSSEAIYRKLVVDNPSCRRRFHIAFEENPKGPLENVSLKCPHCGATVYAATSHPPAILAREENLVKSPDGSAPLMTECHWKPSPV